MTSIDKLKLTTLQTRVFLALPANEKHTFNAVQLCRKVHNVECMAPARDRITKVLKELVKLGLAERPYPNAGYRRSPLGDSHYTIEEQQ